jgi:hypothetical protein
LISDLVSHSSRDLAIRVPTGNEWQPHASPGEVFDVQRRCTLQPVAFEDVGPQWGNDKPWQTQHAKILTRGLTSDSPWMRHQRRVLFAALGGLLGVIILVIAVATVLR